MCDLPRSLARRRRRSSACVSFPRCSTRLSRSHDRPTAFFHVISLPPVRCRYFPIDREHLRFSPIVCVRHRNAATVVQTSKSIKEIDLKILFGEADTVEILRGQASSLTGTLAHENRATGGRLKAKEIFENILSTRSRRSGMNGK